MRARAARRPFGDPCAAGEKDKRKASKGTWGMPRLSMAKKDVTSCEKPRLGANARRPADVRMGEPAGITSRHARSAGERGELKHLSTRRKRK